MSKKAKIIILIVILIVIVVIAALVIYIKNYLNNKGSDTGDDQSQYANTYVPKTKVEDVDNMNKFYAVKNMVTKYYLDLASLNNTMDSIGSQVRAKADDFSEEDYLKQVNEKANNEIIAMLDDEYKNYSGITTDNIKDLLGSYDPDSSIFIDHIYRVEESEKITTYFVYAYSKNNKTNQVTQFDLMVRADSMNYTFSILPYSYMQYKGYDKVKEGQEFETNIGEIADKTYNKFDYKNIKENDYLIDLLNSYRNNLLYNTEKAYNTLDQEYREKRFGNIDGFKKYIADNSKDLLLLTLDQYSVKKYDDYTEYTCIDKRGNYYIFRQTAILKYTLLLDTYTLDLDSVISQYDKGTNEEKILINSKKVMQALNLKDYKYVYDLLDNNFKNNYFQTQESFEKYINEAIFDKNIINSESYTEYQSIGTMTLTLQNALATKETKDLTIIMKLQDNRKFTMSFEVE